MATDLHKLSGVKMAEREFLSARWTKTVYCVHHDVTYLLVLLLDGLLLATPEFAGVL